MIARMRAAILVCLSLAASAHADVAEGKKLNVAGMKKVNKQDWSGALELFKKAIAADPGAVLAHYNAASMESRLDKIDDCLADLAWLAKSSDPAAAKALAHGKNDPDLERASMDPRVRAIIGVPELASMTGDAIALERSGVWGEDGSACGAPGYTLTFKKGGALIAKSDWGCNDGEEHVDEPGTWKAKGASVIVTSKTLFKNATATFGPCDADKPGTWCLLVTDAKDGNDHAFHRGPPDSW